MNDEKNKILAPHILQWVKNAVGANSVIQSIRFLNGATSSRLYSIETKKKRFVLRLFNNKEWLREEPDLAPHEAAGLKQASRINLSTPKLVAFDKDGAHCGMPAVLMTRVPGAVELQPKNLETWLDQLAVTLQQIHQVDAAGFEWEYFSYTDPSKIEIPNWSSQTGLWEKAIQIVKKPRPRVGYCFIHRDFHPANVLWQNEKVSGVVDWTNACRGPVGVDIGHCRVNLAMLYGTEAADQFLQCYQSSANTSFNYDLYWDCLSICDFFLPGPPEVYSGWEAFGIHHLNDEMMRERADQYLTSVMEHF